MNVLFITWDGPQVTYLDGLFLPIFQALAPQGYRFHVLQFTWGDAARIETQREACCAARIPYRSVRVMLHPGGVAQFMTAVFGARHIRRAVRDWSIDVLLPRSLMPALAVLAMDARKRPPVVFDADGFAVDERVDFQGLDPSSWTYRILRDIEAQMLRKSNVVLVRTPAAIPVLRARAGPRSSATYHVVSNGRDPTPYLRRTRTVSKRAFYLCYAGSIGSQYKPSQMIEIACLLKREIPELIFRVFTGDAGNLSAALDSHGVAARDWIEVSRLPAGQMPAALLECDLALALRARTFSTAGVAPIKIGEYLLAGLPVIGTAGVGPVEPLIEAGVFFPVDEDVFAVWPWVRDHVLESRGELSAKAYRLGLEKFSLATSAQAYALALADCQVGTV